MTLASGRMPNTIVSMPNPPALFPATAAIRLEIDPRYCDVIVRRWQEFTGKQAVLKDGRTFDEIAQERTKEAA